MKHYCLMCGTELETKFIEGRDREFCPHCKWINFQVLRVSAGVRIEKNGCLLLVKRGIEPWYGKWYMPAGFVEVDEEPFQGAIRETYEETGLIVKIKNLVDIYTYTDDPRGNGIVLLFDADILGGELCMSSETMEAGFFSVDQIAGMELAGVTVTKEVHDWLRLKSKENQE